MMSNPPGRTAISRDGDDITACEKTILGFDGPLSALGLAREIDACAGPVAPVDGAVFEIVHAALSVRSDHLIGSGITEASVFGAHIHVLVPNAAMNFMRPCARAEVNGCVLVDAGAALAVLAGLLG